MSEIIRPVGVLTLDTVTRQIGLLDAAFAHGEVVVDFSGVTGVDSSAVALLLDWSRKARASGGQLHLHHVPSALQKLIAVYGLTELMPVS